MKDKRGKLVVQTDGKGFFWIDFINKDGGEAFCNNGTHVKAEEDARQIVRCVNNFDELLKISKETYFAMIYRGNDREVGYKLYMKALRKMRLMFEKLER